LGSAMISNTDSIPLPLYPIEYIRVKAYKDRSALLLGGEGLDSLSNPDAEGPSGRSP